MANPTAISVGYAIELRLHMRLQLHAIDPREFSLTSFSYFEKETGAEHQVAVKT